MIVVNVCVTYYDMHTMHTMNDDDSSGGEVLLQPALREPHGARPQDVRGRDCN